MKQTNLNLPFHSKHRHNVHKQRGYIWQTTPAPDGTSVTRCFKLSPAKFVTWCSNCITQWKFVEPDDKLWHPMRKKVQNGTSGATIYHRVTQFYLRVPQFFIGLCNFSTRLQIPRVPIWNTGLHSYRRGPAWSVIYTSTRTYIHIPKYLTQAHKLLRKMS